MVLWEIFADAAEPYAGLAHDVDVLLYVRRGGLLPPPRDMCGDLLRSPHCTSLGQNVYDTLYQVCLLYTSPSPRD